MSNAFYLPWSIAWFAVAAFLSWPLGRWLTKLCEPVAPIPDRGDRTLVRLLGPSVLRVQGFRSYAASMLAFNAAMFVVTFLVLVLQSQLPLDPDGKPGLEPTLAFNTAVSFVTNTNLQHYSGEQALGHAAQLCLVWLQFVSAATGIAVLAAMARMLASGADHAGSFARDVCRVTFGLLVPLALVVAVLLVLGGVPMTLEGTVVAHTLEGGEQGIARGPVAAMVAIKQLGTNGGGFFGPNSTHPLENPSVLTGVVELVSILVLSMACVWMLGRLLGAMRHAVVLFAVCTVLYWAMALPALWLEAQPNAALAGLPVDASLGNLEGKELRLGVGFGAQWAVSTTATSNGSVAAMHDSLHPLGGLAPLVGMWLNVVFGGLGVGMVSLFLYVVVAVFIAGLMVGRTPEYLRRKLEVSEMKLAVLALLLHPLLVLGGTALFAATPWGAATVSNPGSHGFSQILYELTSASANNGSGFEGLRDDTPAWNLATGLVMFFARFVPIVIPMAIAARLAVKKPTPVTAGTFRTDSFLFGVLLLGTVILLGALLFLPAAVLGPVGEHLGLGSTR
jgi:K+-transporting ATPase ATPase A chain